MINLVIQKCCESTIFFLSSQFCYKYFLNTDLFIIILQHINETDMLMIFGHSMSRDNTEKRRKEYSFKSFSME